MRFSKRFPKIQNKINGGINSDIIPANSASYYDFTATDNEYALLDRANIENSIGFSINPPQGKDGIVLVASTDANIPANNFLVNDFEISFIATFQNSPGTAIIFENRFLADIDRYSITREGSGFKLARSRLGSTVPEAVVTSSTGTLTGRSFLLTASQSTTNGMSLSAVEIGGSSYSDSVSLNTSETIKNINPWQAYANLAERDNNTFPIETTIKNFNLKRL